MSYEAHLKRIEAEAREYPDRAEKLRAYVAKCREAEHGGKFRLGTSRTLHRNPRCVGRAGITVEPLTAAEVFATPHYICLRCGA